MIQDLMIGGASIEVTLSLWAASLREAMQRIRPLFTQDRVASSAGQFLDALLSQKPRKTGWMRADAAGDSGPWRQQALLGRGRWDADALRDIIRDRVIEHLGDDNAVLVIDETGFLKQGEASCGVGRQYTGSAGKDHQLPDRRVRLLRVRQGSRLHRSCALSTESLDVRSGSIESRPCARDDGVRHKAAVGRQHGHAGDCCRNPIHLGGCR